MSEHSLAPSRREVLGALAVSPFIAQPALASTNKSRLIVQCRPQDTGSNYKFNNIMRALQQLGGVTTIRCREPYSGTIGWRTYVALGRAGIRFIFTLTPRRNPSSSISDLKTFLQHAQGSIWAIEYPNEPDLNPVSYDGMTDARLGVRRGDAPAFMAYITDVHRMLKNDPQLRSIPIIASNDHMQAEQGPLSDFGNSHIYPKERSNVPALLARFDKKVAMGGHRQGVITEWGRTTGGGPRNVTAPPVTPEEQGELLAADLEMLFADPTVAAVCLYELFSWGGPSEMQNFGLFDFSLKPRPAVAAISSLLR